MKHQSTGFEKDVQPVSLPVTGLCIQIWQTTSQWGPPVSGLCWEEKLIEHMLASIREENTSGTKLVLSVVPSVCRGLCAPNSGLLVSLSHKSALAVQQKMPHNSLISATMPCSQSLQVKWHHRVGVLIADRMNKSWGMKSTVNDPPITIRQCCLALMNT